MTAHKIEKGHGDYYTRNHKLHNADPVELRKVLRVTLRTELPDVRRDDLTINRIAEALWRAIQLAPDADEEQSVTIDGQGARKDGEASEVTDCIAALVAEMRSAAESCTRKCGPGTVVISTDAWRESVSSANVIKVCDEVERSRRAVRAWEVAVGMLCTDLHIPLISMTADARKAFELAERLSEPGAKLEGGE